MVSHWLKLAFVAVAACLSSWISPAQCGFQVKPINNVRWYRGEGWQLPGLQDASAIVRVNLNARDGTHLLVDGSTPRWPKGLTVSSIEHRGAYRVTFPEAIFEEDGVREKMLPSTFDFVWLWRWEMNGRTYAYTYELFPAPTRGMVLACTVTFDVVDDKGDGKFRLMTSPGHPISGENTDPPHLPEWLNKPKS